MSVIRQQISKNNCNMFQLATETVCLFKDGKT